MRPDVGDASDQLPTPAAWDAPVTRPDDQTATQNRAACTYKRGDMPAATLGTSTPVDKDIPIKNVIVVMMENHSFDNYFGQLNKALSRTDVECPDGGETNRSRPRTAARPSRRTCTRRTSARSTRTTNGTARTSPGPTAA